MAFVTLTFPDNCTDGHEASRRFDNLATGFLRRNYDGLEFVTVPERQRRGAFHFHLVCAFGFDVRTGFDFDACTRAAAAKRDGNVQEFKRLERIYLKSANAALRGIWRDLRKVAPRYGFGRCETLPVLSNAQGLARYVGAYVTSATGYREQRDKGLRFVRYSMRERAATIRWSWADGNGRIWRRGLQLLGQILELNYEQIQEKFGAKGWWRNRETISLLGQNYDEALCFVSKIPEWADETSRVGFLVSLAAYLRDGVSAHASALHEIGIEQPF